MAFNKVSFAFLLLALVATTAHARVNLLRVFDNSLSSLCPPAGPTSCSCYCNVNKSGRLVCKQNNSRDGDCPAGCSEDDCDCTLDLCPTCFCSYEVKKCPKSCTTTISTSAFAMYEALLASETN
ncbi:hypothetical protein CsatA_001868 [Cannabis sativa]